MKKTRSTPPPLRKKSKSRKKLNKMRSEKRISTSKKPTKKRISRKKRSKRQKGGMRPEIQEFFPEAPSPAPVPIVVEPDFRPLPFNPSAPTAPSARSFAIQTDAPRRAVASKIKKTKQSNFFDKPEKISLKGIPEPPKGLLDEKEYIVFQEDIGTRVADKPYFIFISSFGRYLHFLPAGTAGTREELWMDMSSPDVAKTYQLDTAPLFFINQGWISLLNFLDTDGENIYTHRLMIPFMGPSADRIGGSRWRSCIEFIPRFLSLYVQFFPDSVITETNNDPDVFF